MYNLLLLSAARPRTVGVSFVYVSSIGRVLNQKQYLVKDCGLRGDVVMLVLSLVTIPHLH